MRSRPNLVLAIVAGLVVVLAVVAWAVASRREPPKLDPTTPEGIVQTYILALVDGDDEAAVARLDPSLGCSSPLPGTYLTRPVSLTLVSSRTTGQDAVVVFDITEHGDSPFDSWSHRETFQLSRSGSAWLIVGNPWPVYGCK